MKFSEANSFLHESRDHWIGTAASLSIQAVRQMITDIIDHEAATHAALEKAFSPQARKLFVSLPRNAYDDVILPEHQKFVDAYIAERAADMPLRATPFVGIDKRWGEFYPPGRAVSMEIKGERVGLDVGSIVPKAPASVAEVAAIEKNLPDAAADNRTWTKARFRNFVDGYFQPDTDRLQADAFRLRGDLIKMNNNFYDNWRLKDPQRHKEFVDWLGSVKELDVFDIEKLLGRKGLPPLVMFKEEELRRWTFDTTTEASWAARNLFETWSGKIKTDAFNWMSPETQVERNREMPHSMRPQTSGREQQGPGKKGPKR